MLSNSFNHYPMLEALFVLASEMSLQQNQKN